MSALFFFSVSLLCSALSLKIEALKEAKAAAATIENVERPVLETSARGKATCSDFILPIGEVSGDANPQANEGAPFYPVLELALAQFDCRAVAQIHLPSATEPAEKGAEPITALKHALAALRHWEADFAICRNGSHIIVTVVALRPSGERHEPERAVLEEKLSACLATADVPMVRVSESNSYDIEQLTSLLKPHLVEASRPSTNPDSRSRGRIRSDHPREIVG